jgi:hypothetical protein
MRTTEPWSLSDWLTAIGIGLTALGIMLATAGLATPAVLTGLGVATGAFGVASTVADLHHRSELGILTDADTHQAILFIAADIVSVLTLGIGRASALAGEAAVAAGRTTQVVVRLRQAAALATLADKALGRPCWSPWAPTTCSSIRRSSMATCRLRNAMLRSPS